MTPVWGWRWGVGATVAEGSVLDGRDYWNKRADTFAQGSDGTNESRLLGLLALEPGQTVLDMGCATGTLAVPLGRRGHAVHACDFAERMLKVLGRVVADEGLPVTAHLLAWEDDWAAEGLGENCVDAAIASRSLGSRSMRERLRRLDGVARHKAAITVSAGVTPSRDPRLLALLGREVDERPERVSDAVGILCDLGRLPVVAYLPTLRPMTFATLDDGLAELRKMVGSEPLDGRERTLLDAFAAEHLERVWHVGAGGEASEGWRLDYSLPVVWAFIGWRTDGEVWT